MRTLLIATFAALALTLGACGGDDELNTATPATTPDLTIPNASVAVEDETTTSTTSTTDTTADEPADDTGASGGTAAPATPTPETPATPTPATPDDTGGTAEPAPATPDDNTGGAEAGGTSDFCAENPGAC